MNKESRTSYIWKIIACAMAYPLGVVLSGMTFHAVGAVLPSSPIPHASQSQHPMLLMLGASLVLAAGMVLLAEGVHGSFTIRAIVLCIFVYVSTGVNNVIEATRFMIAYAKGGASTLLAFQVLPCVLFALALALWIRRGRESSPFSARATNFFSQRSAASWVWRMLAVVAGFPVIYFFFGMCVSPIVVPYYRSSGLGLTIPSFAIMLSTATERSALFLAATLPVLILWQGTRRRLTIALGLGFTVLVGWFPLLQASFLPPTLRIAHSLEICADSFVYAILLTVLLAAPLNSTRLTRLAGSAQDTPAEAAGGA